MTVLKKNGILRIVEREFMYNCKLRKFDYGDQIKINQNAPIKFRPGEIGSIYSITILDSEYLSKKNNLPLGSILFGIEYIDGTDCQVPEEYLIMDVPHSNILEKLNET
jgi:hypothetical protein